MLPCFFFYCGVDNVLDRRLGMTSDLRINLVLLNFLELRQVLDEGDARDFYDGVEVTERVN